MRLAVRWSICLICGVVSGMRPWILVVKTRWMNRLPLYRRKCRGRKDSPGRHHLLRLNTISSVLTIFRRKNARRICRMQKSRQSGIIRSNRNDVMLKMLHWTGWMKRKQHDISVKLRVLIPCSTPIRLSGMQRYNVKMNVTRKPWHPVRKKHAKPVMMRPPGYCCSTVSNRHRWKDRLLLQDSQQALPLKRWQKRINSFWLCSSASAIWTGKNWRQMKRVCWPVKMNWFRHWCCWM